MAGDRVVIRDVRIALHGVATSDARGIAEAIARRVAGELSSGAANVAAATRELGALSMRVHLPRGASTATIVARAAEQIARELR